MYIVFILRICASFFVQRMRKIIPGNFRLYWADLAHTPSLKSREFKEKINFILIATSASVSFKKNHIYSFYFFFSRKASFYDSQFTIAWKVCCIYIAYLCID